MTMSIDPKHGRYCDGCGRAIDKAVRVHLGRDYCRACYQTTFVRDDCPGCGAPMRRHKNAGPTECSACERSKRTCIRCGRLAAKVGMVVGRAVACASCAPYFREARPCTNCGKPSTKLSRPLFAGLGDAMCESCRRRLNHATCAGCGRYRLIADRVEGGQAYCKDCVPGFIITHECPSCGVRLPGGGLARCRPCATRAAGIRRSNLLAAGLEQFWLRELWLEYTRHVLATRASSTRLHDKLEHALGYFHRLGLEFDSAGEINAVSLAERIDSRFARQHLSASRFVKQKLLRGAGDVEAQASIEQRRLDAILTAAAKTLFEELLRDYAAYLQQAAVATRTARLYLRSAQALCSGAQSVGGKQIRQAELQQFLTNSPGHGASLARFVSFCRIQRGWDLRMPPKSTWASTSARRATLRLNRLKEAVEDAPVVQTSSLSTKAVARVLSAALGLSGAELLRTRKEGEVRVLGDGSVQVAADAVIAVNHPLHQYAIRWAELAARA